MAHVAKFKRADCGGLFAHYERKKDKNGNYIQLQNKEIDKSKTHMNYNLCDEHELTSYQFVRKRMNEVTHNHRRTQNIFCDWIVTLPDEVKSEDQKKFFKESYKFLKDKYGAKNVVSAYVHLDETTPHMHFVFMPVTDENKLDCKSIINRGSLKAFHGEFKEYMNAQLGYNSGVLNGATEPNKGNRSVQQMKQDNSYLANKNRILKEKQSKLEIENIQLQNDNIILENELKKKNEELIEAEHEINYFRIQLIEIQNKIKVLISMLHPLEQIKSILNVIWEFKEEFIDKIIEISKQYEIEDDILYSDLQNFYDVASEYNEAIDQISESLSDIVNENIVKEDNLLER